MSSFERSVEGVASCRRCYRQHWPSAQTLSVLAQTGHLAATTGDLSSLRTQQVPTARAAEAPLYIYVNPVEQRYRRHRSAEVAEPRSTTCRNAWTAVHGSQKSS